MPHWSDPLLGLLDKQPSDTTTLTLTLDEVAALVGAPLPRAAASRTYWRARASKGMGQRLRAAGWWVVNFEHRWPETTLTFMRYALTPRALPHDNDAG